MASMINISVIQTGAVTPVTASSLYGYPGTLFHDTAGELYCTPGNNLGDGPTGYMKVIRVSTMEVTDFLLTSYVVPCDASVVAFPSPTAGT